nr:hypothetical protein [Ardenticatena sp.]
MWGDWRTQIERRLPLVWSGALFWALVAWYGDWRFDDPFITYRYARNLARGVGLVYTPSERVLSTTSPLWTLLLAPIAQMGLPIPPVAVLLGIVALSLSVYLLGHLGRQWQTPLIGVCGMFVFPLLPTVRQSLGSELPLLVLFGLAALSTATRGRAHATALLLALATLTRTDALLLALLIAGIALVRRRFSPQALVLFTFPLAIWHGWAWWYYGSPLPSTLGTKQAQARMAISRSFAEGLVDMLTHMVHTPGGLLLLALLLMGIGALWWHPRRRMWGMLIGWGFLHSVGYAWLHVSRYSWYYVPLMLAVATAVGCGVALFVRRLPERWRTGVWAFCILSGLFLLWQQRTHTDARVALYTQTGRWLAAHTPPEATIGTLEVGIVGYYAERPMVDFAGLLQPELSTLMFYDTNYDLLALWAFARNHPDYVVIRDDTLAPLRNAQMFRTSCRLEQTIQHPSTPRTMLIYACHSNSNQSWRFLDEVPSHAQTQLRPRSLAS